MAYIGGKAKGADFIIEQLNDPLFDGHDYIEPFIGYAHILRRVEKKRSYAASDANPLVIALLRWIKRREASQIYRARDTRRVAASSTTIHSNSRCPRNTSRQLESLSSCCP